MIGTPTAYETFRHAQELFEARDYTRAAGVLADLVATWPDRRDLTDARELLARSYYHSAQLDRAIDTSRELLADHPGNDYAALLLARSLQRAGRHLEAATVRRVADIA